MSFVRQGMRVKLMALGLGSGLPMANEEVRAVVACMRDTPVVARAVDSSISHKPDRGTMPMPWCVAGRQGIPTKPTHIAAGCGLTAMVGRAHARTARNGTAIISLILLKERFAYL